MVLESVWSSLQACPERVAMAVPAGGILTPTTDVTSVETGATMPMTATVSTREEGVGAAGGDTQQADSHN